MSNERKFFAFTETIIFTEDLLEFSNDETLYAIQNELLANPLLGDLIKGTHGARKGRIGNPKQKIGKSGGFRYIYIYLEKSERIYLLAIYSKREKADLTPKQAEEVGEMVLILKKKYRE